MLCNLVLLLPIYSMYSTTGVSHNKWGYELIGEGLHSSCASLDYIRGVFKYLSFSKRLCNVQPLLNFEL